MRSSAISCPNGPSTPAFAHVAILVLAMTLPMAASANETPPKPVTSQAGRPAPNPDPRARTIPELVCTGERAVTVANDSLEADNAEAPLRLRLRGNLLYLGQSVNTEKFFGLINRVDRRRWTSGTATLLLDEALEHGAWVRLEFGSTRISAIHCQPFDSSRR